MENKKTEQTCKKCIYCDDIIGTPMCYRAPSALRVIELLCLGPRPITNMNACKFFKRNQGR